MDENEVEIRVTIRDDTAAGAASARARARRLGRDLEKDAEGSGQRSGRGFLAKFRESLSGGGGSGAQGLASKLIGSFAGVFQLSAKTLATGFSYQFVTSVAAGLASGAAKMVHGLAAIGALLPAIAATGVVAFGTVKLAVAGVGDALKAGIAGDTKKFNESIKGLAPSAQGFAKEVAGMRGELTGLQRLVQQNFFAKFSGETSKLGATFLPMLRTELGGVGSSFGSAVSKAAGFLQTPKAVLAIRVSLQNMGQAIGNVTGGLGGMLQALLPLVAVGSTFLPRLTAGFGDATARVAEFMTKAAETGRIAEFIQGGLDKLESLGETAGRVWQIAKNLAGIFRQLGGFGSVLGQLGIKQGGLLAQLETLTDKANKFFSTSAGGKAMAEAIRLIRELLNASMGMFAKLVGVIAPFAPQISRFVTAVQKLMTAIVDAAKPAIELFLGKLLPAITTVVEYITKNTPLLQGILIGLFTAWAISAGVAAVATIAATWPLILLGIAVAAMAVIIIKNWEWIKTHWPLLLMILTGPIGLAVAIIISHWDKIVAGAKAVWHWIQDNWKLLLAILMGPFTLAAQLITENLGSILSFIKGLPGKITEIGKTLWGGLKSGLAEVVQWVIGRINAIIRAYNAIPKLPNVGEIGSGVAVGNTVVRGGQAVQRGGYRPMAHGGITGGVRELADRGRELLTMPGGRGVLVDVPPGSTVHSNPDTERMLSQGGGGEMVVTFEKTGDALIDAFMDAMKIRIRKRYGGDPVAALEYRR